MRSSFVVFTVLACLPAAGRAQRLISLQSSPGGLTSYIYAKATGQMAENDPTTLPLSDSITATTSDLSESTTGFSLQDSQLRLTFSHQLSGAGGSSVDSEGEILFTANTDLHVTISGRYAVQRQLWTSSPPNMNLRAHLNELGDFDNYGVAPVALVLGDSTTSGINPVAPLNTNLHAGQNYTFIFGATMTASAPGSAATAAGNVALQLSALGAINGDGAVGFSDLLTLAQHWGATGASATYADGCLDNDENIGFDDLLLLAQRYGESFPAATAAVPAVPEPAIMPGIAVAGLLCRRRSGIRGHSVILLKRAEQ